jgi:hypothetical protein
LIDDELNTIISSQALKTQIILPENIKAKLVRGKTYIWNIEAISEENLKLDSASISFEIE